MHIRSISIGLLLLPATVLHAADASLYQQMRDQVDREQAVTQADESIVTYLQGIYRPRWELSREDVLGAMQRKPWEACTGGETSALGTDAECIEALEAIPQLAAEEQALRSFGTTLQRIAASQEVPLTEIPGRPFHMSTDLSGIIQLWQAGTGSIETPPDIPLVRTRPLTTAETDGLREFIEDFQEEHADDAADLTRPGATEAIVWRYQYGVRFARGERGPRFPAPPEDDQSGPGTERQEVFRRWNGEGAYDMEGLLMGIWDRLPKDASDFDPPLADNDVAYVLFPEDLHALLPAGTLLWGRVDGNVDHAFGDVGLIARFPLQPFLPSMLSTEEGHEDEPILGGRYPPPPTEDVPAAETGLCSMSLAGRGFLCRPFVATEGQACPVPAEAENTITLVSCTIDAAPTVTDVGVDVCADIEWRNDDDPTLPVCEPSAETRYKNTIGNNACYIGACVEESLELHRITGGRSPIGVSDSAFPWDAPATGEALATVLRSVPATMPPLPSYQPEATVRILEDALCQLQGLPVATPPHLCAFSPSQRLNLPLSDNTQTALQLTIGAQDNRDALRITEELASALGSRIGTDLQGQYLRVGTRSLSDVIGLANTLLKETLNVRFPINMCPLSL